MTRDHQHLSSVIAVRTARSGSGTARKCGSTSGPTLAGNHTGARSVRQAVPRQQRCRGAHPHPHGREALRLPALRHVVLAEVTRDPARADSHRGQAAWLRLLRQALHPQEQRRQARALALRQALQLCHVRAALQPADRAKSFTSDPAAGRRPRCRSRPRRPSRSRPQYPLQPGAGAGVGSGAKACCTPPPPECSSPVRHRRGRWARHHQPNRGDTCRTTRHAPPSPASR